LGQQCTGEEPGKPLALATGNCHTDRQFEPLADDTERLYKSIDVIRTMDFDL